MSEPKEIERKDFPPLYRQARKVSASSQQSFFRWNLLNLIVLTAAALLTTLKGWVHAPGAAVAAALLAVGAFLTFWLRKNRYERLWYTSRAITESVKTLSWRYMMCASPFTGGSDAADEEASAGFNNTLQEIAAQEEAPVPTLDEISLKMRDVRQRSFNGRLALYMKERVEDQRRWYDDNRRKNEKLSGRYLFLAAGAQIVALACALILAFDDNFPDAVGLFATVSAGYLAWLQLRRCEDLVQAYKTAAKELVKVAGGASAVHSDADLSRFVLDAENAISREHTLWLAKRA